MPRFVVPLTSPQATLELVGGKALNLGELARAGFAVPAAVVVSTDAYRAFLAADGHSSLLERAARAPDSIAAASAEIQALFAAAAIPGPLVGELNAALSGLKATRVAVRSSATAEDLADLSFAGQQDTYLDVEVGPAVLDAVRRCWGSLWSERAMAYRARNGVAEQGLAIAVVVQTMVAADSAGVAFTADPLSGRRDRVVIEAARGTGDALVSGHLEPERIVVDPLKWELLERRLAPAPDPAPILSEAEALEIARAARRVEEHFGVPQDVEWARAQGTLAILQARPITTLFPLPDAMRGAGGLRVYFNSLVAQGVDFPLTPLGAGLHFILQIDYLALLSVRRPAHEVVFDAGGRQFFDITELIADPRLRRLLLGIVGTRDQGARQALLALIDDGRITERRIFGVRRKLRLVRTLWPALVRIAAGMFAPRTMRRWALWRAERRLRRMERRAHALSTLAERVEGVAADVGVVVRTYWVGVGSLVFTSYACHALLNRWLPRWGGLDAAVTLELLRGVPGNGTTEMNLALWELAQAIRADIPSRTLVTTGPPEAALDAFSAATAPAVLQRGLRRFLDEYGIRGDAELDIATPRWRDDPSSTLQTLRRYLQLEDPDQAPDAAHRRGARQAEQRAREVTDQVTRARGRAHGWIVERTIGRMRALAGLREFPKFANMRVLAAYRPGLLQSGAALVAEGVFDRADDIFFASIEDLRRHCAGAAVDLRTIVRGNRADYERERARRQVPRILLSTGEAFHGGMADDASGGIVGDPVSPGVAEGRARIVLDPRDTRLAPGEILVCPRTDPGWTPLFLTAAAVIMEVGGMTTHGSVVAREHGIPAVVSVNDATLRIKDGDLVRVDGTSGRITVIESAAP